MKKLAYLMLCAVMFGACTKSVVVSETPQTPKEVEVSFGVTGEIVDVVESPFTRADEAQDLYGIQIYSCSTKDATNKYTPYGYIVCTDVSALKVKLLYGYKYKFAATMVVGGTEKIYHNNNAYSYPFNANGNTPISTNFTLSTQNSLYSISTGYSFYYLNGKSVSSNRPALERFYGEVVDYLPAENGKVTIDMVRTSYKVKVVATGKFKEGTVKVTMEEAPDMLVVYGEDKKNDHFEEETYTFQNVAAASKDKKYSETVKTSFYWIKDDGTQIPLKTNHEFTFKRNKQTTITIKVDDVQDNGVGVTAIDEDITLGDEYYIENGDVTDTGVNVNQ